MTTQPVKRGRPPSGQAKPPAQRMAAMRRRTVALVNGSNDTLEFSPASGLFEALRVAYRQGGAWEVASICDELIARLSEAPGATVRIKARFTPL